MVEYSISVNVPHGITIDGKKWLRVFYVRELNGYDEQHLINLYDQNNIVYTLDMVIELMSRIIKYDSKCWNEISLLSLPSSSPSISTLIEENKNDINLYKFNDSFSIKDLLTRLTVGDRTAILLQFQRLMFGNILKCDIQCTSCEQNISLEVPVSDLILPTNVDPQMEYDVKIDDFRLKLRPVNGKDQKSFLISSDMSQGGSATTVTSKNIIMTDYVSHIIKSCVKSDPPLPKNISENIDLVNKISTSLEKIDPQSNIVLDMKCPLCSNSFKVNFFIEDFVLQEIYYLQQQLDNEINFIALYYHWSENEILSLPLKRRKKYLELIKDTLTMDIENE